MEDSCEVFASFEQLRTQKPLSIAIGFFDGVHLGHQRVLREMLQNAIACNHLAVVLTFHPHPSKVVSQHPTKQMFPSHYKLNLLQNFGIKKIVHQEFTDDLSKETPEGFLAKLKEVLPTLSAIYVGEHFHFGKNRSGTAEVLKTICAQLNVQAFCIPRLCFNEKVVSSSLIRQKIAEGLMKEANALLGYPYFIHDQVFKEQLSVLRASKVVQFFIPWNPELRPKFGVYAVKMSVNQKSFKGIARYALGETLLQGFRDPMLLRRNNKDPNFLLRNLQEPVLEISGLNAELNAEFSNKDFKKTSIKVEWLGLVQQEIAMASLRGLETYFT